MCADGMPDWASEDITPEGSAAPVYINKPGHNDSVTVNDPSPDELLAAAATARADGIAKLIAGKPLTEEEAMAVAGG